MHVPSFQIQPGGASNTGCDRYANWFSEPHFATEPTLTFSDPVPEESSQCGDLVFDDRTRTFTATYTPNRPDEAPYRYWWRRGRKTTDVPGDVVQVWRDEAPAGVTLTRTIPTPLLRIYDGLGAILLLTSDSTLSANEGPFINGGAPEWLAANLWVQHWRRIDPPILNAATVAGTQVQLSWSNFHLGRSIDGTVIFRNDTLLNRVGGAATSYTDSPSAPGIYTYALKHFAPILAVGAEIDEPNSAQSNTKTVTIALPAAPSNLTATAVSATQINLAWTDNATNEAGFSIERAPGGTTSFAEIATVGTDVTSYQNTGLAPATSYSYRVRAYNALGNSDYSNSDTATTLVEPLSNVISGPDLISVSGTYRWFAQAAGGTPPYSYGNWYYRRTGQGEQLVGTGQSYSPYVLVEPDAYIFRLRQVASDAAGASDTARYFVEVVPGGGFLAATASGVRFADGSCRPRPPQPVARQRWLEALFERGLAPQPCQR